MSNDNIKERIYIKGNLQLVSPLVIGSGQDENTDIDLIRDWTGTPFIPGTAIAGAIRHYLDGILDKELVLTVFGKKEKDSTQSLISFYDALLIGNPKIQIRDGVRLKHETKTAQDQAKYDYEILEPGQQFCFKAELVIREKDLPDTDRIKDLLYLMLNALKKKKISFGAKTRRGFGVVSLCDEKVLCLNMSKPDDVQKWIDFTWDFEKFINESEKTDISVLQKNILQTSEHDLSEIKAEFEIPYSVLIRHYSESPDAPDTTHLASDGNAVIPGTSWNGAIRHAIYHILKQLNKNKQYSESTDKLFKKLTTDLFGYVSKDKKEAKASRIFIKESLIAGGQALPYIRKKVDRFTGGVVDSALFEEMPHYGGKVKLDIAIKKPEKCEIGLILLALKDMGNGIQPIGGDANIGRGILNTIKNIEIKPDTITEDDCLKALADKLQEQKQ